MYQYVKSFFLTFLVFVSFIAGAQNNGKNYNINSPYSRFGLGDLKGYGSIRNIGMGGTGVSQSHHEFLNNINPALLINNRAFRYDSLLNILDGGIFGQIRNVSDQNARQTTGGVNFLFFDYGIPVNKRWTLAVGLRPLTDVSFYSESKAAVTGSPSDTAVINYSATGGLTQAHLTNAFRINRFLNFGLSTAYVFGTINREYFSYINSFSDSIRTGYTGKTYYSGFLFRPGLSFRMPLEKGNRDSTIFFNAGITYEFFTGLDSRESLVLERRTPANLVISKTELDAITTSANFPSTLRLGVSVDKFAKWNYALDFSFTNWKNATSLTTDSLANSFTIAAGGEWAFDKDKTAVDASLKRKYFRAGFTFTHTPYVVEGNRINDLSFSIGYSFPIGRKSLYGHPLPKLNLAVVAGQRGTTRNNLVKDQYLMGYVGITINDKWFKRRRIE